MAFSPSSSTRGDGALAVVAVPSFQHSISSAQRRRGAVATFAPHTNGLFAITAHPWPFRHHRAPVATAPSPSRPFPASNIAYHPHSDGEAPSLRLLRTPMAFSPSSHTRGDGEAPSLRLLRAPVAFFAITTHPWPFRPHRTPVATAPSPSRPIQAHSNSNLDLIVNSVIPPTCDCVIPVNIVQLIAKLFL